MVQNLLEKVYASSDACRVVAYVDLSAQLVLSTNDAAGLPRDALNTLCAEAVAVSHAGPVAVIGTGTDFKVFVSDTSGQKDGMICICGVDADINSIIANARTCLNDIHAMVD